MCGNELKKKIEDIVIEYVAKYPEENGTPDIWRTPLVGYADAKEGYIRTLKEVVIDTHAMPEDFLEGANVVIAYFIPFKKELAATNIGVEDNAASAEWAEAYKVTNTMMGKLSTYLAEELNKMGYRATVPVNAGLLSDSLKSNWSQRHVARAAGLGTFGINNMLITKEGCCGRYNTVVADIPVEPDKPLEHENCLYKSKGLCKKCVTNCFYGALTEEGFDRFKCFEACEKNREVFGVDVCGKCATNIPCAFTAL